MSEPDDITPPPEQRLPAARRQAMLQSILAAADAPKVRVAHRWVAPALTAAAVVVIVAGGGLVTSRHHESGGTPTPLTAAGRPSHPPGASCRGQIAGLHLPDLGAAESVTADRRYAGGRLALHETKQAWVVCDDPSAREGGPPVLFQAHRRFEPYHPDASTLAILETAGPHPRFVAAGRDFDGVRAISYTFPDGTTVSARVGVNGLWSMTYLPSTGILRDGAVDSSGLAPVVVTVHYTAKPLHSVTLQWGKDICLSTDPGC